MQKKILTSKEIEGYEGLYIVRNNGDIISSVPNRRNKKKGEMILTPKIDKDGYLIVNLYKDRKMKSRKVHRLVAAAFVENTYGKPIVNHKDGDKSNNNDWNLEWCTVAENTLHGFNVLGRKSPTGGVKHFGEENHMSKPVICDTLGISFGSIRIAHKETGILPYIITEILQNKRLQYNGLTFKYK